MAEALYYKEICKDLFEHFGQKQNINAKEYAEYLGVTSDYCRQLIRDGFLPGKYIAYSGKYIIPIRSIAVFEANLAKKGR